MPLPAGEGGPEGEGGRGGDVGPGGDADRGSDGGRGDDADRGGDADRGSDGGRGGQGGPGRPLGAASVGARIAGILLFLPVPAVLLLFTRMPFGVVPSLAAGLALMMSHPLYARPWALHHASHRCLWCGGPVAAGARSSARDALAATDPRGTVNWGVCRDEHRASLVAMLRFAARHGSLLRVGILGTVTVSLVAALLADRGWAGPFWVSDASALFRLGVGLTVLPLGWLGPRLGERDVATPAPVRPGSGGADGTEPPAPLGAPFPLHLAALIGVNAVLWLFRLVGLIWLAQGAFHVVERVSRG